MNGMDRVSLHALAWWAVYVVPQLAISWAAVAWQRRRAR